MGKRKAPFWYERLDALERRLEAVEARQLTDTPGWNGHKAFLVNQAERFEKRILGVEHALSDLREVIDDWVERTVGKRFTPAGQEPQPPKCPKCGAPAKPSRRRPGVWCCSASVETCNQLPWEEKPTPTLKKMVEALAQAEKARYGPLHPGRRDELQRVAEICAKVAGASRCPKCDRALVGEPGREKCEACDVDHSVAPECEERRP
jgi:ribosomal protein L37AE/L43A